MSKTRVGIINVTGYAGAELARLLARHPEVDLAQVTGRSAAGKMLSEVYPHLVDADLRIDPELDSGVDFVISALPHAASASAMVPFIAAGVPCIDISADFRIKDLATYESTYKTEHPCPEHIDSAVYGLPELHREAIRETKLVANPGCYPTGTILGLAPAFKAGLIHPGDLSVISDSKSGVSGAGRSGDVRYNFSELNDNMSAYAVGTHRHAPEMEQELGVVSDRGVGSVLFVPHLAPMTRGILGTHYVKLTGGTTQERVAAVYADYYAGEPFVKLVDAPPATKETWGSNDIRICATVVGDRLVVVTALDNLVKGAAGAAVQNMNVMLGLEETAGLEHLPVYP